MTVALIVVVVLLVIFLLGQIPLVIGGVYQEGEPSGWIKLGGFTVRSSPSPKKSEQKPSEQTKKPPQKKRTVAEKIEWSLELAPAFFRALGLLSSRLRVKECYLLLVLPGEDDPARSAQLYGWANGVLGALWTPLVGLVHMEEGRAGVRVDFTAQEMTVEARGTLTIKLGQLVVILTSLALQEFRIVLQHRRQNKLREAVS